MARDFSRFPVPALAAVTSNAGEDPFATVYASSASRRIIVCPNLSVEKGLYIEQEAPISLAFDSSFDNLGQSVWDALLLFSSSPGLNLRSQNKADWPAYRVSDAKSIRAFEEEFVRMSVRAFPCVLRVEAAVPAHAAQGLYVGREISNSCQFESLGELIHLVYRCSVRIAEQEFA